MKNSLICYWSYQIIKINVEKLTFIWTNSFIDNWCKQFEIATKQINFSLLKDTEFYTNTKILREFINENS